MKNISYLCNRFWAYEPNTIKVKAPVAELVDASDLGSGVSRRAGSSPVRRTALMTNLSVKIAKSESNLLRKDKKMQIF